MKAREDFVTNSSSCSYVVMGISVEKLQALAGVDIRQHLGQMTLREWIQDGTLRELCIQNGQSYQKALQMDEDERYEDFIDELDDALYDSDLYNDVSYFDDIEDGHVGWGPWSMTDDETLGQFKERVARWIRDSYEIPVDSKDLDFHGASGWC